MDPTIVAGQVTTAGTALAGLILVFLGNIFTSFNSYDADQQSSVKRKYRMRGLMALAGFVMSLLTAVFGLLSHWWYPTGFVYVAIFTFASAFLLILILASMAVADLF